MFSIAEKQFMFHLKNRIMKFSSVITIIIFSCLGSLQAQEVDSVILNRNSLVISQDSDHQIRISRAWVRYYGDKSKVSNSLEVLNLEGALYQVADSSILISNSLITEDYLSNNFTISSLNISDIESIAIRRKGTFGRRVLVGTLTGFAVGAIIGAASGDDPPCQSGEWCLFDFSAGEKAMMAGVGLGIIGAGVGAAVGSIKVNIPINRSMGKYKSEKKRMRRYSIIR